MHRTLILMLCNKLQNLEEVTHNRTEQYKRTLNTIKHVSCIADILCINTDFGM